MERTIEFYQSLGMSLQYNVDFKIYRILSFLYKIGNEESIENNVELLFQYDHVGILYTFMVWSGLL